MQQPRPRYLEENAFGFLEGHSKSLLIREDTVESVLCPGVRGFLGLEDRSLLWLKRPSNRSWSLL